MKNKCIKDNLIIQFKFWSIYKIRRVSTKIGKQYFIKLSRTQKVKQDVLNYCFGRPGTYFAFSTYQSINDIIVIYKPSVI